MDKIAEGITGGGIFKTNDGYDVPCTCLLYLRDEMVGQWEMKQQGKWTITNHKANQMDELMIS